MDSNGFKIGWVILELSRIKVVTVVSSTAGSPVTSMASNHPIGWLCLLSCKKCNSIALRNKKFTISSESEGVGSKRHWPAAAAPPHPLRRALDILNNKFIYFLKTSICTVNSGYLMDCFSWEHIYFQKLLARFSLIGRRIFRVHFSVKNFFGRFLFIGLHTPSACVQPFCTRLRPWRRGKPRLGY